MNTVPGIPNLLRRVNRSTIFRLLENLEVASRAELSERSNLSPPTVSAVVRELIEEGWAREVGAGKSNGGKRPNLIQLNPNARCVIAVKTNHCVKTEGARVHIRLANLLGEVKAEEKFTVPCKDSITLLTSIAEKVRAMLSLHDVDADKVLGVGLSVPGVVDDMGIVASAPELGWVREDVRAQLSGLLQLPIVVENNVKLAALADLWKRQYRWRNMIYLHLGLGIGAGIIIDGKLHRGAHFLGGEIGHMVVDARTVMRPENLLSPLQGTDFGVFEKHFGWNGLDTTPSFDIANGEDSVDWKVRHIAYCIANLICTIDPEAIVLGGPMVGKVPHILDMLRVHLASCTPYHPELCLTNLGDDAPLIGAVRAVIDHYESQVDLTSM